MITQTYLSKVMTIERKDWIISFMVKADCLREIFVKGPEEENTHS